MGIPTLITDLAAMLLMAAAISIVFKKLHLPAILGYISAGFFLSSYFPWIFSIQDTSAVNVLSEVGVIVILFHIGLEFDLHKLTRVGSTAIVTAAVKMGGVMVVGYLFGSIIGLSRMNCVFLGVMLSISSTVVIQKSFEELKVTGEKYTSLVMGTLIMEDLISVFMMVILASMAAQKSLSGSQLAGNLLMMGAYLIVWLVLGIIILPTFLNRVMRLMSQEMLVVLSLGVCFGMALIAKRLGFSVELGAFLAGSLFAGTIHAEKVIRATEGVKDMFAVIFFLSVGMLVDPNVVVNHWKSIVPIAIIAVIAKLIFATLGMILSGHSLGTAVKSGLSLAPIGEFSFIIASLGISLGVMDRYLYPVIVSASVLTTLVTPFLIKKSGTVTAGLYRILPEKLLETMRRYSAGNQDEEEHTNEWVTYVGQYFRSFLLYGVFMIVDVVVGCRMLYPALKPAIGVFYGKIVACIAIYLVIAVLMKPYMNLRDKVFTGLWLERKANRPPLAVLSLLKLVVVIGIIFIPIRQMYGAGQVVLFLFVLMAVWVVGKTDFVGSYYLQMETRFLRNLNEKTIHELQQTEGTKEWLNEDIHIFSYFVPEGAEYAGKSLEQLHWGRVYGVLVVKIRRGERSILLPSGRVKIRTGDKLYLVGDYKAVSNVQIAFSINPPRKIRTLRGFMENDYPNTSAALACLAIHVTGEEPYVGKTIMNSHILDRFHCMILGIQKEGYTIMLPDPHQIIGKGDVVWIMGSNNNVGRMASLS